MRTLDREVKNLQTWESRSPERYQNLLDQWICKSHIKLISAQLVLKKTDEENSTLKSELKSLITKQQDLRIAQLSKDVATARKRLEKSEVQLKGLRSGRAAEIKRQMDAITKNAERILAIQQKAADAKKKAAPNKQPAALPDK